MSLPLIMTDPKLCFGCNKCIAKCPVGANDAVLEGADNKIVINHDRCIECGECIRVCDHGARSFVDDTENFFTALSMGQKITVIAAPAVRNNFPEYKRLFGYLKSLGVSAVYDVSFGADICTWAYLRAYKDKGITSMISQPCPVIVQYIEGYKQELLPRLAPVHSPAMCEALYLRKYKNVTQPIAFLSPCIAKKIEFSDPNTNGEVSYNVTYAKLEQRLKDKGINLMAYPEADFEDAPADFGVTFSRPGGLKENVLRHVPETWIRQVEGIQGVVDYFAQYSARDARGSELPELVDVLNCPNGCNMGTATCEKLEIDDIDINLDRLKKSAEGRPAGKDSYALFDRFDKMLDPAHFERKYRDIERLDKPVEEAKVQEVFGILDKSTPDRQNNNCFSCGYGSCRKFAEAVASGHNHVENCKYYARTRLDEGRTEFDDLFNGLDGNISSLDSSLDSMKKDYEAMEGIFRSTRIIALNANIEAAHAGQFGQAFSIVANEVKSLADKSAGMIQDLRSHQENISGNVEELETSLGEVRTIMDGMLK